MVLARQPGWRDLRRAWHRHHQASSFLTDGELQDFADYKRRIDPDGRFNKGKLLRCVAGQGEHSADLSHALHAQLRADGPRVADHAAE